jgi:hypothetical protein
MDPSVIPREVVASLRAADCPLLRPGKPPLRIKFVYEYASDSDDSESESDLW